MTGPRLGHATRRVATRKNGNHGGRATTRFPPPRFRAAPARASQSGRVSQWANWVQDGGRWAVAAESRQFERRGGEAEMGRAEPGAGQALRAGGLGRASGQLKAVRRESLCAFAGRCSIHLAGCTIQCSSSTFAIASSRVIFRPSDQAARYSASSSCRRTSAMTRSISGWSVG